MKILHLTGDAEDTGGILSVIRHLMTATVDSGWQHSVWVNRRFVQTRPPHLDLLRSWHACGDSPSHSSLLWRNLLALPELLRTVQRGRFDVVHAHTRGTFLLAAFLAGGLGRKTVFTNHNYARKTLMYRFATDLPDLHSVFLTPNMATHYGVSTDHPQVSLISACCADATFDRPVIRSRRSDPNKPLHLIGVGNLVRWKNWHLALEAILLLPETVREKVRLAIWGPTPNDPDSLAYEQELKQFIAKHDLAEQVRLEGPTNDVLSKLASAEAFLLPSTNEPCSVALIESLASGMPAIVSASGGNLDIIRPGETGAMFEPDNALSLADTIARSTEGKKPFVEPEEIRRSVRPFRASVIACRYRELYETVRSTT